MEKPVRDFLEIVLAVGELEKERTGIDPLLSRQTYDYAVSVPVGWDYRRTLEASAALQADMDGLDARRSGYIRRLLQAVDVICHDGMGEDLSYAEKVRGCLGLETAKIPRTKIDELAAALADRLGKRGYNGELSEAVRKWKKDTTITAAEELQAEADGFLQQAIERTNARVLPVPEELDIDISFPNNFPYNGYSESRRDYVSRIMLSGDVGWPRSALKHLVTHEALPGHTLYYATKEKLYRTGRLDVEGTVYLANTPVSPLGEGLCEIGQEMLGMIEDEDDRIFDLVNRLSSAVITNTAIDYNDGAVSKAQCLAEMQRSAFITELQAEKRFGFFSHPLWYISFMHYWFGRAIVHECFMKMRNHLEAFYNMAYLKAQTICGLQEDVENFLKDSRR
jgi:hypothetical protein